MINVLTTQEAYESNDHDVIVIGFIPFNETLPVHIKENKRELEACTIYIAQLKRNYGECPTNCSFFVLHTQIGENNQYEACIKFPRNSEAGLQYAMLVELGVDKWDNHSLTSLDLFNPRMKSV